MACKFIFVAGSCFSSCGKGATACSIGLLLRLRQHNVSYIKLDPYLSLNSGILSPQEHGETFVCDDGTETDLDLGHAERIIGIPMTKANIATSGMLYKELIEEQEQGKFLGQTIQIQPHLTDKIQQRLLDLGNNHDIVIAEIGGTVGDSESFAFFEAIRQFKWREEGKYKDDILIVMVAPVLWVNTVKEFKTKPLQNGIKELQKHGIQPNILFCRPIGAPCTPEKIMDKIANLTNVTRSQVFDASDVPTIYQIPINFYDKQVDDCLVDLLRLKRSRCHFSKYREIVEKYVNNHLPSLQIGVFGKYDGGDAYISLKEAIIHAGVANDVKVDIRWIKSEELEKYKDNRGLSKYFDGLNGVICAPGFDQRGIEGKIKAIQYAREKKIPFLGICLGLQCAVIEFARNVCGFENANSIEFDKNTPFPVINFVNGQESLIKKSGTMRLGAYDCDLAKDSLAHDLYRKSVISERHRHRYEVNSDYVNEFAKYGFMVSGKHKDLIEIMELDKGIHPFYIGTQAHPEFRSNLTNPSPLFDGLIKAAKEHIVI